MDAVPTKDLLFKFKIAQKATNVGTRPVLSATQNSSNEIYTEMDTESIPSKPRKFPANALQSLYD